MGEVVYRIENLTKIFNSKDGPVTALNGIDLTVEEGDIYGIIGLSGAGKSTLVRCMNLLEKPTGGKVFMAGEELTAMKRKKLLIARRQVGMIFQGYNLLEQRTALKNVCFPLEIKKVKKKDAEKRALELLEIVGLKDRAGAYPSQLSGGQKQRVAIARALAADPKVLLCDEATSALDPDTTDSILALIKDINRQLGVTVIIITHEMKVIEKICNKVAVIDGGVIAESGLVSDVFVSPKSDMGRRLILKGNPVRSENGRTLRLVFDGISSKEPVISGLATECGVLANIRYADTKDVGGYAYGEMLIEVADDENVISRVKKYFKEKGVSCEEREDR